MKTALLALVAVVLMAASGGVGYYFGNDNGFKQAQNIRTEFINQRLGGQGAGADATQGQRGGQTANGTPQAQGQRGGAIGTQGGQLGQLGGLFAGRLTANGAVKSVQGNTITVTQGDGTTATVTVDDKTTIQKLSAGAIADVQSGLNVLVTEQNNLKRVLVLPAQ